MSTTDRREGGRPVVTAQQAATMLGRDVRTIRRMIETRQLDGYAREGERRRWFVYLDQLLTDLAPSAGLDEVAQLQSAVASLTAENAQLRADLVSERETTRLLLAAQPIMREALDQYRASVQDMAAGVGHYRRAATEYQSSADNFLNGANGFRAAADNLSSVVDAYSDALNQHTTPGNLGTL